MKKLGLLLFALSISLTVSAQIGSDTLTPEKKARAKINVIYGKKITQLPNYALSNALRDITNLATYKAAQLSMAQVRLGLADTVRTVLVNEGLRSGTFRYDASNTTSLDDSAMVLRFGAKRYIRIDEGIVRPEWFGADPTDSSDDYEAVQKALNSATDNGLALEFSRGSYYLSNTIKPKKNTSGNAYRIKISGKGREVTSLRGMSTLAGKNLLEFKPQIGDPVTSSSAVKITDMDIWPGRANRGIYANYVVDFRIEDIRVFGGDTCGVEIGDKSNNNYSVYIHKLYTNGVGSTNGHNKAGLRIFSRYPHITEMVCDGSMYGIEMVADQGFISGCTLEGNKRAGIYAKTSGGGSHKIIGNTIRPYVAFEPAARFNGTITGIIFESIAGGSANNTITGNVVFVGSPATYEKTLSIGSITGTFLASPSIWKITGATSGAQALVYGVDASEGRLVIGPITGGPFVDGETINQTNTSGAASAIITSQPLNHTYGIQLLGNGGYNNVSANQIMGGTEYGVISASDGNNISGNVFSTINGIQISNNGTIVGNRIYSSGGIAVKKTAGSVILSSNLIEGNLDGIGQQQLGASGLRLSSTEDIQLYNTSDQTTNFERAFFRWSSNILTIGSEQGGTGSNRDIQLNAGLSVLRLNNSGDTKGSFNTGNTALTVNAFQYLTGFTSGSLHQRLLSLNPTINQSGTGSYSALHVSVYEQSVGSGAKALMRLGTNTGSAGSGTHTDKFVVSNTGAITSADIPEYADNAAAVTAGLVVGRFYRTADVLKVVH